MLFKSVFVVCGFGLLLAGCSASQVSSAQKTCSVLTTNTPENAAIASSLGASPAVTTTGALLVAGNCAVIESLVPAPVTSP